MNPCQNGRFPGRWTSLYLLIEAAYPELGGSESVITKVLAKTIDFYKLKVQSVETL
jgi:hypothetical protein